jgi:hypothetical protein
VQVGADQNLRIGFSRKLDAFPFQALPKFEIVVDLAVIDQRNFSGVEGLVRSGVEVDDT